MTHYHVHAAVISKGAQGGARGFHRYLNREPSDHTTDRARYQNGYDRGREDLVDAGHDHLPRWAQNNAAHFWAMADTYERANGVVARAYQFALPKELSRDTQLALSADIRATFFAQYPHSWAVHEPACQRGEGTNSHLHVMFSPRRDDFDRNIDAQHWFARAAPYGQDCTRGGVRKDPYLNDKRTLLGVRHESAVLINSALEREGVSLAISERRIRDQGHGRDGLHFSLRPQSEMDKTRVYDIQEAQDYLRTHQVQLREQRTNCYAWDRQKHDKGIASYSRDEVMMQSRDRFWTHDTSAFRNQERTYTRTHSLKRSLEHLHDTQRVIDYTLGRNTTAPERTRPQPTPLHQIAHQLKQLTRGIDDNAPSTGGLRVRLTQDEDHEYKRGMDRGW